MKNSELKEIASDIEVNKTHNLGKGLLERNGQPMWDDAIYFNVPASGQNQVQVASFSIKPNDSKPDNVKQWVIPLTKNKTNVDAILICQKTDHGFYYNLITEATIRSVKTKEEVNKQVILYAKLNNSILKKTYLPEIKIKDFNARGIFPNKDGHGAHNNVLA